MLASQELLHRIQYGTMEIFARSAIEQEVQGLSFRVDLITMTLMRAADVCAIRPAPKLC